MTLRVSPPNSALHARRQGRRDSTGSAANSALGEARTLLPHSSLSQLAELTVRSDLLALSYRDETICDKLQAWRELAISNAVRDIQRLNPEVDESDTRRAIRFRVEDEIDAKFDDVQTVVRRYKSAELKTTLCFVREQALRDKAKVPATPPPENESERKEPKPEPVLTSEVAHAELARAAERDAPRVLEKLLEHKRYELVQSLVDKGVYDPRGTVITEDGEDLTLLAFAVKHELPDSFLHTLIQKGADVRGVLNLLSLAMRRGWDEQSTCRLISLGAPIPRHADGVSPLETAYRRGQMHVFRALIVMGADSRIEIDGKTLLGRLVCDREAVAQEFVSGKFRPKTGDGPSDWRYWISYFDLEARGANGQNVLHDLCGATYDISAVFLKLVELGANPEARNGNDETPVMLFYRQREAALGRPATAMEQWIFGNKIRERMPKKPGKMQ